MFNKIPTLKSENIFIRIPRTGSTSLLNSINNNDSSSLQLLNHGYFYKLEIDNIFERCKVPEVDFYFNKNMFKNIYAIVRNPFDLLISYYNHVGFRGKGWGGCNDYHNFSTWDNFLEAYIEPNFEWHLPPMKFSLFSMGYDKNGHWIPNRYFKLENPNNINNFLYYHGYLPLQKLNSSNRKQKQYYTPSQVKKLNKIWEHDLNHFDYQYKGQ